MDTVKNHLKEINISFTSVEFYINDIANDRVRQKKYNSAENIYNGCLRVYPESATTYFKIGESYLKRKMYQEALINYSKSLKLNPVDSETKKKIQQVKLQLP